MSSGLPEHLRLDLRLSHLLRGRTHERQSLQVGLDKYWCWLLQEENTRDLLIGSTLCSTKAAIQILGAMRYKNNIDPVDDACLAGFPGHNDRHGGEEKERQPVPASRG